MYPILDEARSFWISIMHHEYVSDVLKSLTKVEMLMLVFDLTHPGVCVSVYAYVRTLFYLLRLVVRLFVRIVFGGCFTTANIK